MPRCLQLHVISQKEKSKIEKSARSIYYFVNIDSGLIFVHIHVNSHDTPLSYPTVKLWRHLSKSMHVINRYFFYFHKTEMFPKWR